MEIRHADLQIEVEDAEDGGVLLTIIDAARLACHIDDALHLQHLLRRRGPPLFVHLGQFAARPGQFVGQGLAWVRRPRGRRGAQLGRGLAGGEAGPAILSRGFFVPQAPSVQTGAR